MSPSEGHQDRVELLEHMGRLAGCTVPCSLTSHMEPDVLLAHPGLRIVFLGEAKRSETPGNTSTARRLRRYVREMLRLQHLGFGVRIAICGDPQEAGRWSALLDRLAASERAEVRSRGSVDVAYDERVVWIDLLPTAGELPRPLRPAFLR